MRVFLAMVECVCKIGIKLVVWSRDARGAGLVCKRADVKGHQGGAMRGTRWTRRRRLPLIIRTGCTPQRLVCAYAS